MELIWMPNAQEDYLDTLAYWYKHNGSFSYSDKSYSQVPLEAQALWKG